MADPPLTRRQRWTIAAIAFTTAIAVLGAIAAVYTVIQHHRAASQTTVAIHVLDKRADCPAPTPGDTATCTWRIFTDAGTFADHDEPAAHKLNSHDLFDHLMYGGVYEVEIRGARHDSLGQYPNVIKIAQVIARGYSTPAMVIALSA